jgi:hypothetical protein
MYFYKTHQGRSCVAVLTAIAAAGCLAFLLPWFTAFGWSYAPYEASFSPFSAWFALAGVSWFALMLGIATCAVVLRRRVLCALGAVSMLPTAALLIIIAVVCSLIPSFIPNDLRHVDAHGHRWSFGVSGGVGSLIGAVSAVLLLLWFLRLLMHSSRLHHKYRSDAISERTGSSESGQRSTHGALLELPDVAVQGMPYVDRKSATEPPSPFHEALQRLGAIDEGTAMKAPLLGQECVAGLGEREFALTTDGVLMIGVGDPSLKHVCVELTSSDFECRGLVNARHRTLLAPRSQN